tara:strand:- start:249 stop:869 length:621 start_codon:yes stop_codon:yes gene_type:complete
MSKTKNGVATLTSAKKPSLKNIKAVIEAGITQVNEEFSMTQIIQQDLFTRDKKTNETLLTKELNKLFESGQDEKIDKAKKWIKTRLQTLIKEKTVQELLLGEEKKNKSLTIKKVKKTMIGENKDEKYLSQHNENDLGKFRVIIESKKPSKEKSFQEELMKLLDNHNKTTKDLLSFSASQGTAESFKDEVLETFKEKGLTMEIKLKK